MKDKKYKITIDNAYCESAYMTTDPSGIAKIDPFDGDNCPDTGTFSAPGLPKRQAIKMMASLRADLQYIFDEYNKFIKTPNSYSDDW